MKHAATLAALLTLAASVPGQIGRGETGLVLLSGGNSYGFVCSPQFSCTYEAATLVRGNAAEIQVRGVRNRPYAVAFGFDLPHLCIALGGVHNQLMGPIAAVPAVGVLSLQDTIRACPGGLVRLMVQVPAAVPIGSVFTMQALTWSYLAPNEVPTLTIALRVQVR